MKQVAYVNYTLNKFNEFPKFMTLCLLRTVMYNKLYYLCFFLSWNLINYPQNLFFCIGVEQHELEY